jgi:hypothetical protein
MVESADAQCLLIGLMRAYKRFSILSNCSIAQNIEELIDLG